MLFHTSIVRLTTFWRMHDLENSEDILFAILNYLRFSNLKEIDEFLILILTKIIRFSNFIFHLLELQRVEYYWGFSLMVKPFLPHQIHTFESTFVFEIKFFINIQCVNLYLCPHVEWFWKLWKYPKVHEANLPMESGVFVQLTQNPFSMRTQIWVNTK